MKAGGSVLSVFSILDHWLLPAIPAVVGAVIAYIAAYYQRGSYFHQMHAVEVATKRIAYWAECVKLSELANGPGSDLHAAIRGEASIAITRIRDEANQE